MKEIEKRNNVMDDQRVIDACCCVREIFYQGVFLLLSYVVV